ncbi:hypothetical protein P7C73_g373, partial [Tremellales sp. Uapishka_1]
MTTKALPKSQAGDKAFGVEHIENRYMNEDESPEERTARIAARATLQNALHGIPKSHLLSEVNEFCTTHKLDEHREIFRKGALLAQRPGEWDNIPELNAEDRAAIAYEHKHKWAMSGDLIWTVTVCALGAAVQGWDQTGSNGANLSFPAQFGIGKTLDEPGGAADNWKVGLVNSIPYLSAPLVGCWIAYPLNKHFGRRGCIFFAALILIATPIGMAFTQSWQTLLAVRLIFGIGIGLKGTTVPVFAAEVSPTLIRGALDGRQSAFSWDSVSYIVNRKVLADGRSAANAILRNCGNITWRLQIGSSFLPAIPLALLVYKCESKDSSSTICLTTSAAGPESPRWFMRRGEMDKAFASMRKLRKHDLQAARDLYYAWVQWEAEKMVIGGQSMLSRFLDLFRIPRIRRATLAASVVHLGQDLCGINTIAFYSSTIFVNGGASIADALYASLGFGALNFVFTWPAVFTIDTFGRRSLNLLFFPLMAISLLAAGMAFYIKDETTRIGIVALVSINYFVNFILSCCFPFQLNSLGGPATFGFYFATNIASFILAFLFMRETKQLTLEEIDQVFNVPIAVYVKYQVTIYIPYFFKRYLLCQRRAKLAPLFYKDKSTEAAE